MNLTMHQRSPGRRRDLDFSRSPIRDRDGHSPSHPTKSYLHTRRSPVHHRSPPGMKSSTRNGRSERKRSPTKERMRERSRSPGNDRSKSPVKKKMTSSVRSSRQVRSRSPLKDKSPYRARSPKYIRSASPVDEKITNHARPPTRRRSRSPAGQRFPEHHKSPRRIHSGSPISSSRSPSPRTKRLRQAQVERDTDKTSRRQEVTDALRDHNRGRNREKEVDTNVSGDRKLARDKRDGGTSRSSRHAGDHSVSPLGHGYRHEHGVRSPSRTSKTAARDDLSGEEDSISRMKVAEEALEAKQKQKPSFELSGKLAEETNRVRGVTLLFTEPSDARKPDVRWRLYVFKAGEVLNEPLYVHRQSCYLFGRERRVADIPTDHPSCSKQHAVLQYRLVEKEQPDGLLSKQVRPYVMDLGSTNGTFLNDERIEPQRYYELCEKDVIKFGNSSREYVVLHENSVK